MRNLPYQPLLLSLLAAVGAAGCGYDHEKDFSYVPGEVQPIGQKQLEMPPLPCLPRSDPRLEGFNPSCGSRYEITEGPGQSTNAAGKTICVYHMEYDESEGCTPGRPLLRSVGAVLAPLVMTSAWG